MDYKKIYETWMLDPFIDEATKTELKSIAGDEKEIEERFYRNLEFGTAGLRGKLGAGTNRMNIYVVARATQGLADYIKEQEPEYKSRGVVIAHDPRHFSSEFAERAALVLASNGIRAYLFDGIRPTPELSFAVGKLHTAAGIVITASHNPKEYNGYKVYWEDGAQILSEIAESITSKIESIEKYSQIPYMSKNEAFDKGLLVMLGREIDNEYIEKVKSLSLREDIDRDIKIVYTPLNGAGSIPVKRVLRERGFSNITVVPEQENPDPNFTTVEYPNPEDRRAFTYAEQLGKEIGAQLLIATDPDSDRLAVQVKGEAEEYIALNGNQVGAILIQYILQSKKEKGQIPNNGVIIKSIVTGDLGKAIAENYGVVVKETLTGFKNICGKAMEMENRGDYKFLFGYEESIGYIAEDFVRDKDGISAAMLICEAAAYYKTKGMSLWDTLQDIFREHGYFKESAVSIVLEGIEGQQRIKRMMEGYRKDFPQEIDGIKLLWYADFKEDKIVHIKIGNTEDTGIPRSDVLKYYFEDGSWYAVRPSGTEPKMKIYVYTKADNESEADRKVVKIRKVILQKLESIK